MNREKVLRVFLWWAVLGSAVWIGGTVFQMLVVVPMWSSNPPETVRSFFSGTRYNETILNFFGLHMMLARNLPILGALVASWKWPVHRRLLLITAACTVSVIIYTAGYVHPINSVLMTQAGGPGTPDEIRAMVGRWIFADRARLCVGLVAFIALLRAFSLPVDRDAR